MSVTECCVSAVSAIASNVSGVGVPFLRSRREPFLFYQPIFRPESAKIEGRHCAQILCTICPNKSSASISEAENHEIYSLGFASPFADSFSKSDHPYYHREPRKVDTELGRHSLIRHSHSHSCNLAMILPYFQAQHASLEVLKYT